jgi:hypothetical protein
MEQYIVNSIFGGIMGMYAGFVLEQLIRIPDNLKCSLIIFVGVYGVIKGYLV